MIEFEIDAELFCKVLDAVSKLSSEPALVFSPEGLSMVTMNGDHTILANLGIKKSVFNTYEVDKKMRVSFDVSELSSYLQGAGGNTVIQIENGLSAMTPSKYGFDTFTLELLAEIPDSLVPRMKDYESVCKMDLSALLDTVRKADKVKSDGMDFHPEEDSLVVDLKGESSKAQIQLEAGKAIINSSFNETTGFYTITKLFSQGLSAGVPLTNVVKLCFSSEIYPILLDFQIPFDGLFQIHVAPALKEGERVPDGDIK